MFKDKSDIILMLNNYNRNPKGYNGRVELPIERFLSKISVKESGCWEWTSHMSLSGYGLFWHNHKTIRAHRFSYEYFNNTVILNGLEIDHLCRNRVCVNPDHLEVVTKQENIKRGQAGLITGERQKAKTHCPKGHPYNDVNTYYNPTNGKRTCRICTREAVRKYGKSRSLATSTTTPLCHP